MSKEKQHIRFCQVTVRDKTEGCLNQIQFAEEATRDLTSVKDRLLERSHETTYSCSMCKGVHDLKDAEFAYQKSTIWDGVTETNKDGRVLPGSFIPLMEPCGEDEFTIIATNQSGKVALQ